MELLGTAFGIPHRHCVDAKRTLRCVLPASCPSKLSLNGWRCPTGRICCQKDRPSPYMSIRRVSEQQDLSISGRSLVSTEGQLSTIPRPQRFEDYNLDEDRIIFPSEFSKWKESVAGQTSFRMGKEHFELPGSEDLFDTHRPVDEDASKSVKYCREYTQLTIDIGYASPLLNNLIPLKYEMENCEPRVSHLVVGGSNATIDDFPHMVALGYNISDDLEYFCGGTLISDQFVITAAHCAQTKWGPPAVAYMGATELHSKRAKVVLVDKVFLHPNYQPPSLYHDIALLKLSRKLKLTTKLRPACLPTDDTEAQYPNHVVVATGWGRTGFGREVSNNLKQVALKVINNTKCRSHYRQDENTPGLHYGISNDMICAIGNFGSSEDTCQGDSGGPLQSYLTDNRCVLQVVGITAFGKSCATGTPGVYTRVSSYLSWIEDIVWP